MKKLTACLTVILLFASLLVPGNCVKSETNNTSPTFTAVGDSISYGYSADKGNGYADLLYNYLKVQNRYTQLSLNNSSVLGLTTTGLLNNLSTDTQLQNSVKKSNIITLSIGGNNLLGPVIGTVATAFNVNTSNNPNLITDISQDIKSIPEATRPKLYAMLMGPASPLPAALTAGNQQFISDFPDIIKQIKALAPQAKIYVLTIYNPFATGDIYHDTFDKLIQRMNSQIKSSAAGNYEVVDVYAAFNRTYSTPVVSFNFLQGNVDPHPTNKGHEVIFESHITTASAITLDASSKTVKVGQSVQLTASVVPSDPITNPDVVWTSSDNNTATVDKTGKVTGIKEGSVVITAATEDGNITKQCKLTVDMDECFIATAAYGSKFQPCVVLLRHFRDDYLLTNGPGTSFVKFYYKNSPPIAEFISHSAVLKNIVKILLMPFVTVVYGLYHPVSGFFAILMIILLCIARKRCKFQFKL